jgi:hypothetical protein
VVRVRASSKTTKARVNLAVDLALCVKLSSASDWSESERRAEGFAVSSSMHG